jgi:5-formyltetrahydrofolate cyclo-ligase
MPTGPATEERERFLRLRVKQELRRRMRRLRRVIPADARAARSQRIAARVLELAAFRQARTVVAYRAIGDEVDPAAILEAAEAEGKRLGLPRMENDSELTLRAFESGDELVTNEQGIAEPTERAARLEADDVDLIVVPALVVDARGHRIGYGRGFYDRLLPTLARAHAVAVAFDFQLVAELPDVEHDAPVHTVITDERTLPVRHA